jgi:hypothetical protein
MNRRQILSGTSLLLAMPPGIAIADPPDEASMQKVIQQYYSVCYRDRDKDLYRSLLASDDLLLENGTVMDAAADIALMPALADQYDRVDSFDFKYGAVTDESAYQVYSLKSVITEATGTRNGHWVETAILRRSEAKWLIAVLHSTKIAAQPSAYGKQSGDNCYLTWCQAA